MSQCTRRMIDSTAFYHHEFEHIYDEIDEDYFPVDIFEDDDEDIIEAQKCHRTSRTYIRSICKY